MARKGGEGKKLEAEISGKLTKILNKEGIEVVRLYDSFSTKVIFGRAIIPAQPADLIILRNDPFVEIKTTIHPENWTLNNLKKKQKESVEQYAKFTNRYFVLLFCTVHDYYFLLPASYLQDRFERQKKRKAKKHLNFQEEEIQQFKFDTIEEISEFLIKV
jgi:hypothetical protein